MPQEDSPQAMTLDGALAALDIAQKCLHKQETNLRLAEQLLNIVVWNLDTETGRIFWCEHAHHVFGVTRADLAPDFNSYVEQVHPDDRAEIIAHFDAFKNSDAALFNFAHRILRPDSSTIHLRGVAEREERDGTDWLGGVIQDVTAEVQAREKLAEASRMERIAKRMARLGGWRIDLNPTRTNWSPRTFAIHEMPEEASPSLDASLDYYAPEYRERLHAAVIDCGETGQPFDEIAQLITAKGKCVWVRVIGEPLRDEHGTVVAVQGAIQDISDLVAEHDRSEGLARRLRQTLESISDAFYLLDCDWRFSFVNCQAENLLRRSRENLFGKVIWDEFPEAVGTRFQSQYEIAVSTGQAVRFQDYYPPLNGWYEINAHPTPEGLAVYFRDVTEQRARDEHLRLLEAAVSRQNDILLITKAEPVHGPDGPRIVYVNDAFVKVTGFTREEAIGRTPHFLQGPKTQRAELDRIRRALENWQPVRAELINYTKSGEEVWLELDIVPLADENGWFTHWVSIERDATERKRAETAMYRSEERFRMVVQATNDVISDWDMTTGSFWWNENLKSHFGYDPGEVEAGPQSWINRIHPEDADRVLESIEAAIAGLAATWTEEYRFLHADGRAMTCIDRAFITRDSEGKAIRMLGSMVDVTNQRETERRLSQSQKLEAVGQLTGGVAHDFNNLLTVILGNAEMLSGELGDMPRLRTLAEAIVAAAERGSDLTHRLLAFSRKQPLRPQLTDAGALVHETVGLLHRTLSESIDIEIVRAPGLWKTEVDPSQLASAILNLALNARDAMAKGGRLTIETNNVTLDDANVAGEQDVSPGDYVTITVSDTGEGIPSNILGHIFEPFFTTKEVGMGSGLGLSMVYGFVMQSGGHVRVESEPGIGTTVKLYFPRSFDTETQVGLPVSRNPITGGADAILIVEDDALVRENLVTQLSELGYQVIHAAGGPEAIEILKHDRRIDLLFTDIVMPGGMNGRELADAAMLLRPGIKVLFTSGYAENAIVRHGELDPDVNLLSKPYRREQLAVKIREVLERS